MSDISAVYDDITRDANANTHSSYGNQRSEAILSKYRDMINKYRLKSSNIIISNILCRINAENSFYDKAFSTNDRLVNLCKEEGVAFLKLWDHWYNHPILFKSDNPH